MTTLNRSMYFFSVMCCAILCPPSVHAGKVERIEYSGGEVYEGETENGKKQGQGTSSWLNGSKYIGSYKNDTMHGAGEITWADGSMYVGNWENGERHGKGTLISAKGDHHYIGMWKNDKKDGVGFEVSIINVSAKYVVYDAGTTVSSTATRYDLATCEAENGWLLVKGRCEKGKATGGGKAVTGRGSEYFGSFLNGKRHGKGTLINRVDGHKYVGMWKEGHMNGKGTDVGPDGKYIGMWENSEMHGQGARTWTDGTKYIGCGSFGTTVRETHGRARRVGLRRECEGSTARGRVASA